jgi:hypothetical protein
VRSSTWSAPTPFAASAARCRSAAAMLANAPSCADQDARAGEAAATASAGTDRRRRCSSAIAPRVMPPPPCVCPSSMAARSGLTTAWRLACAFPNAGSKAAPVSIAAAATIRCRNRTRRCRARQTTRRGCIRSITGRLAMVDAALKPHVARRSKGSNHFMIAQIQGFFAGSAARSSVTTRPSAVNQPSLSSSAPLGDGSGSRIGPHCGWRWEATQATSLP